MKLGACHCVIIEIFEEKRHTKPTPCASLLDLVVTLKFNFNFTTACVHIIKDISNNK